jgi:hypothetical protein
MRALRGLTYHADIMHEPIDLIIGDYNWNKVSKRIDEMIKNDTTKFLDMPF